MSPMSLMSPHSVATTLALILLMAALPTPALSDGFGRVFFTPRDRVLLDDARRRKERAVPKAIAAPPRIVAAPAAKPERPSGNVTLNGIVRRSDGESTIWVNGVAMPADAQTGKVQVAPNSSQSGVIRMPTNAESAGNVELKVGQKLDLSSGSVTERYLNRSAPRAGGATTAPPSTPRPPRRAPRTDPDASESQ